MRSDWTLYEGDDYDCIKKTELKYLLSIWAIVEAILTTGGFDSCERVGNYDVIEKHGKHAPIRSAKLLLISVVCIFVKRRYLHARAFSSVSKNVFYESLSTKVCLGVASNREMQLQIKIRTNLQCKKLLEQKHMRS